MIDFLVIGGGIAGLSAGARLSEHGHVVVLEAEDALGYHTSGRSAALFEKGYGPPSVKALNAASEAYLVSNGYLSPRGLMLIGGKDQREVFLQDQKDLRLQEIPLEDAAARVPILNPQTVGFAAVSTAAFDIDTDRMLQDFARVIRGNGGTVVTRQKVTSIEKSGHWIVQAGDSYEARNLVNAAGAWVDEVATMAGDSPHRHRTAPPVDGAHSCTCRA